MNKYQVGDIVIGSYKRFGVLTQPICAVVSEALEDGWISIIFDNPYGGEDQVTIHESTVCSIEFCRGCVYRLTRLITGGFCPVSYEPINLK